MIESRNGVIFLGIYFLVTLATYAQYLRCALTDPGYINNCLSFNRAYIAETEVNISGNNLTNPDKRLTEV
jgi:hypothetical protein